MTTTPQTHATADPEDRRKHLEFIQTVIARLSNSSATAKGWGLTLAGAAFGFSAANNKWYLALLGCVVLIAFSVMDAYYLHSEKLFRALYKDACAGNAPIYAMDPHAYAASARRRDTYRTWSVLGFYGPLLLAGGIVTIILALSGSDDSASDSHHHQDHQHSRHDWHQPTRHR